VTWPNILKTRIRLRILQFINSVSITGAALFNTRRRLTNGDAMAKIREMPESLIVRTKQLERIRQAGE
jgi:hypothetical protein